MKLYLAGFESFIKYLSIVGKHYVLCSYFYTKEKINVFKKYCKNLLVDSGGFSARTLGVDINVKEYGDWLIKNQWIKNYFNLDNIDINITQNNQKILEEMGLNPIPVWHPQYGKEELERLTKKYDYIGIGNITGGRMREITKRRKIIEKVIKLTTKYKIKIHLFGVTDIYLLQKFSKYIYSSDSTTWLTGGKFGHIYLYDKGNLKSFNKKSFYRKYGRVFDFRGDTINRWNLLQWIKYANYLEKI